MTIMNNTQSSIPAIYTRRDLENKVASYIHQSQNSADTNDLSTRISLYSHVLRSNLPRFTDSTGDIYDLTQGRLLGGGNLMSKPAEKSLSPFIQRCMEYTSSSPGKKEAVTELQQKLEKVIRGETMRSEVCEFVKTKLENREDKIFAATFPSSVKKLFEEVLKTTDPGFENFRTRCLDYTSKVPEKEKAVNELRSLLEAVERKEKKPLDVLIFVNRKLLDPENKIFESTFSSNVKSLYMDIFKHIGLTEFARAKELHEMGNRLHKEQNHRKALACYLESRYLRREMSEILSIHILDNSDFEMSIKNDRSKISECYRENGDWHRANGELERALEEYKKSVDERFGVDLEGKVVLANDHMGIGDRYKARNDFERALEMYHHCLNLYSPNSIDRLITEQRIADVHAEQGLTHQALTQYERIIQTLQNNQRLCTSVKGSTCIYSCQKGIVDIYTFWSSTEAEESADLETNWNLKQKLLASHMKAEEYRKQLDIAIIVANNQETLAKNKF